MSANNDIRTYLDKLSYGRNGQHAWRQGTDWKRWKSEFTVSLQTRLGTIPAHTANLAPTKLERVQCDGYVREKVEISTYEGLRMPLYVLIPDHAPAPRPAVVALHGHGYGVKDISGMEPDGSPRGGESGLHKDFAVALARQGFLVAAPELLGFGERRFAEDAAAGPTANSCFRIAARLMMAGQTLAGHRVYETRRVIDYLQTRSDVSPARIGCMGISGGGLVAAFTAALDERIRATVVSGFANTFERSILDRNHCLDNYIPGLLLDGEMPDVIGLIAPRPLFLESGSDDRVFPRAGALAAISKLRPIYEAAGAEELPEADLFEGGHEISGARSYGWLARQLQD